MVKPIKACIKDKLEVLIFDSREQMGQAAYEAYQDKVISKLSKQDEVRAVFAAAHSQDDFLMCLSQDRSIDFRKIVAFHMDEYIGLPENAPQKFGTFLKKAIFSKVPFKSVNYIQSGSSTIQDECARYSRLLHERPLDIVSMGIGENGHIAFNDPAEAHFYEKNWIKETRLDAICRQQQVNDGEFLHFEDVPQTAFTLTIPALMSCEQVICIVPTARKAEAVYKMLQEPVSEMCPASILRMHDHAKLFLDKEAANKII